MAKVLPLEGPHKKHHDHGPNASVPEKGNKCAICNMHWEQMYNPSSEGSSTPMGAFEPKRAKMRPTPHHKVNECDH